MPSFGELLRHRRLAVGLTQEALAERAGLNMDVVLQAITSGAVASPIVKGKAQRIIARAHTDTHFALRWMHKDMTYALRAADQAGFSEGLQKIIMCIPKLKH